MAHRGLSGNENGKGGDQVNRETSGPRPGATGAALSTNACRQRTLFDGERQAGDGERRKTNAHTLLEVRRDVCILRGRRALLTTLLYRGTATADDVRGALNLPGNIDPVCLGAVPGPLVRAGIIEAAGFAKSRRADAHARPVQVWHLSDRVAALAWLRDHPDRLEPSHPEADTEPTLFDLENAAPDAGTSGAALNPERTRFDA